MADNDDYLDSIDNNHLDGTNGSVNMTDNSLGVSLYIILCKTTCNIYFKHFLPLSIFETRKYHFVMLIKLLISM